MGIYATQNPLQQGYGGFGSFFKGIFNLFRPLVRLFTGSTAKKTVDVLRKVSEKPIAKKILKQSKKELGRTTANVVNDLINGGEIKTSLKKHGLSALKNIASAPLRTQTKDNKKSKKSKKTGKKKSKVYDHL